jgi:hypothetical protein
MRLQPGGGVRTLISIPDPRPIGHDLHAQIRAHGFDGVRVDVATDDHDANWAQVAELAMEPATFPIFLLAGGTMRRDDGRAWTARGLVDHTRDFCEKLKHHGFFNHSVPRCAIEISNEPDLSVDDWKKKPEALAEVFSECFFVVREFSEETPVLSPSISNLNDRGFRYIRKMIDAGLPLDCGIAFHRYPAGRDFWTPHQGSATRPVEEKRLKELANGRALWATEVGWAEWNQRYTLTELEVAERLRDEIEYWTAAGVEALVLYQLNSGVWKASDSDDHKRLSTYGARRLDGSWKPWAEAVREATA